MDMPLILSTIRPGVHWGPMAQTGQSYAAVAATWPAGSGSMPTEQECAAAWATLTSADPSLTATGEERRRLEAKRDARRAVDDRDPRSRLLLAIVRILLARDEAMRAYAVSVRQALQELGKSVTVPPPTRSLADLLEAAKTVIGVEPN